MKELHITIPLAPTTKKNSQKILVNKATGRPFIMPSDKYKAFEKACAVFMPHLKEPIAEPICLKAVFYMPTRRRVDLCNLLECICDILVKYGVIADDDRNVVYSHDGSRVYYDKTKPRCEVYIVDLKEEIESWK